MNIMIAQNIKKLRKQKDITQEELAGHLGISFQAISKWERGEGFPDITILPAIANYFDVTIDELFGMEQIRDQQHLSDVYKNEHEYVAQGKYVDAIKLLRETIKVFPNEYGLLSELAIALSFDDKRESLSEAISLCERVLANSINEKVRSTTRTTLCFLYKSLGEQEKAVSVAKTLPHFWESRELILPEILKGKDYKSALNDSIKTILSIICEKIEVTKQGDTSELSSKRTVSIGPRIENRLSYDLRVIEDFVEKA
jgi:transcriptional regulator with XRE-family HTH domain